jgi:hypothetical protein
MLIVYYGVTDADNFDSLKGTKIVLFKKVIAAASFRLNMKVYILRVAARKSEIPDLRPSAESNRELHIPASPDRNDAGTTEQTKKRWC